MSPGVPAVLPGAYKFGQADDLSLRRATIFSATRIGRPRDVNGSGWINTALTTVRSRKGGNGYAALHGITEPFRHSHA